MSNGVNKAILVGYLGADPELRYAQSGGAILNMRLATSESWKGKDGERVEKTEWHTCVMFGTRAEGVSKHLHKGDRIYVEGRIQTRQWEDKQGAKRFSTEIVVNELVFLGGGKREGAREQHRTTDTHRGGGDDVPPDDFGDSGDIPFLSSEPRETVTRCASWRAKL